MGNRLPGSDLSWLHLQDRSDRPKNQDWETDRTQWVLWKKKTRKTHLQSKWKVLVFSYRFLSISDGITWIKVDSVPNSFHQETAKYISTSAESLLNFRILSWAFHFSGDSSQAAKLGVLMATCVMLCDPFCSKLICLAFAFTLAYPWSTKGAMPRFRGSNRSFAMVSTLYCKGIIGIPTSQLGRIGSRGLFVWQALNLAKVQHVLLKSFAKRLGKESGRHPPVEQR